MVELVDGKPVIVPSDELTGFKPLAAQIEKYITPKTKVLMLNSPNNPTGQMYTREEIADIAKMLKRHPKIVTISDDIYNQLVFDGSEVAPHLLQADPSLKDRVVIVNGASKSFSMTGWRIGWALGPEPLIKAMTNYQSQTVSCAAPFTQAGALAGLQYCDDEIKTGVEKLRERRDLFVEALNMVKGWRAGYPQGAFYVWADIRQLFGKSYQGKTLNNSADVAAALLDAQKVAVVPGGESGLEGYLRLSFALHETDLNEAVKRIRIFTESL
jgi:aspartate aminotransferase